MTSSERLKFNQTSFRAFRHVLSCHGKTKMRPFVARLFNFGNLKSFFYCLAVHDDPVGLFASGDG